MIYPGMLGGGGGGGGGERGSHAAGMGDQEAAMVKVVSQWINRNALVFVT